MGSVKRSSGVSQEEGWSQSRGGVESVKRRGGVSQEEGWGQSRGGVGSVKGRGRVSQEEGWGQSREGVGSVKRRGGVSQEEGWGQSRSLIICCVVDFPLVGHESHLVWGKEGGREGGRVRLPLPLLLDTRISSHWVNAGVQ